MKILGIDPGLEGAFVLTDGKTFLETHKMPTLMAGKERSVDFDGVHEILYNLGEVHRDFDVYLERAIPFAMGTRSAFNYGRGFAALEIALFLCECSVTYIEPAKWTKAMHQGISEDMKPKAKSLIAVKRLYPKLVQYLPKNKNGKLLDGPIDALLMAGYGLKKASKDDDFY